MDEVPTRNHAEAHAKAVVDGDMDAVTADFAPEVRDRVREIAETLPQPTTQAEVVRVEVDGDRATVEIRYSNDEASTTIRTSWEEVDDHRSPVPWGAAHAGGAAARRRTQGATRLALDARLG